MPIFFSLLGYLITLFLGPDQPYFWRKCLLVLRSEVVFNYILSMRMRKDSIIDLGHTQLFSFTSRPTDPILRKGQPEKQNIKLKWPDI